LQHAHVLCAASPCTAPQVWEGRPCTGTSWAFDGAARPFMDAMPAATRGVVLDCSLGDVLHWLTTEPALVLEEAEAPSRATAVELHGPLQRLVNVLEYHAKVTRGGWWVGGGGG
jgi:hypothetical protein